MSAAAELSAVVKQYPGFRLGPVQLTIEGGRALALIGPNGAGKTTLMEILAGMLTPTSGTVQILGHRVGGSSGAGWKAEVGYASEQQPFYERWSVDRNLRFLAGFFPRWSFELQSELVRRFHLPLEKKVKALSKGNRVKLSLVAALARRPRLLLLDEPTAGLDPLVRAEVLDTLWELLEAQAPTILYSTHILPDVGRLADELAFIKDGQIVLRVACDDLERSWRSLTFRLEPQRVSDAARRLLLDHRTQGSLNRAVTYDYQRVADQLRALGAAQLDAMVMPLEEIAVHVLRASPGELAVWRSNSPLGGPDAHTWRQHVAGG